MTRSQPSRGETGQVFGGVVGVSDHAGRVWTMRHVNPLVQVGQHVDAGERVATVTAWRDGGPHLHMEIWRSASGGYTRGNMIDPGSVTWDPAASEVDPPAVFWMEELPFTSGGTGPVQRGRADGYGTAAAAGAVAAVLRASGAKVSTVKSGGRWFVMQWKPGTYGDPFRWGPWAESAPRDRVAATREHNTGRTMRRFRGRSGSLYPWPDNS